MYGINVYPNYTGDNFKRMDWTEIEKALTDAGFSIERESDSNQIFVDGYYGEAVEIINALGYATDEDE